MAAEIILEFSGFTEKDYQAVNKELGIDVESGAGDWPKGIVSHAAGVGKNGRFVVTEVWETVEDQEKFMNDRLGAALAKSGVTGPPESVTWIELITHSHPGS
jgi:hypothetical protein